MLNTDAYNRLIAHIKEDDKITAIAVQALLNEFKEITSHQDEDGDIVLAGAWERARKDVDNLRYAEIELSSYWVKDASDEDYAQVVKTIQAYMPRGWFATLVTKGDYGPQNWRKVVAVTGYDYAGWTLEDYVIPRLASGNWFAKEVTA
jgi:hypothetical protein